MNVAGPCPLREFEVNGSVRKKIMDFFWNLWIFIPISHDYMLYMAHIHANMAPEHVKMGSDDIFSHIENLDFLVI